MRWGSRPRARDDVRRGVGTCPAPSPAERGTSPCGRSRRSSSRRRTARRGRAASASIERKPCSAQLAGPRPVSHRARSSGRSASWPEQPAEPEGEPGAEDRTGEGRDEAGLAAEERAGREVEQRPRHEGRGAHAVRQREHHHRGGAGELRRPAVGKQALRLHSSIAVARRRPAARAAGPAGTRGRRAHACSARRGRRAMRRFRASRERNRQGCQGSVTVPGVRPRSVRGRSVGGGCPPVRRWRTSVGPLSEEPSVRRSSRPAVRRRDLIGRRPRRCPAP